MAPRRRKEINRGLPPGMRIRRDGYCTWTHPQTGVEYGLGRNRSRAIKEVIQANVHLSANRLTLLERVIGKAQTWGEWCDVFEKLIGERDSRPNTVRTRKSQMNRLRRSFDSDKPASKIDTRECAAVIGVLKAEGKHRTAQAFRSFMIDCFDRMIAQGWRKDNPARVLDEVSVKVMRERLSLEALRKVYETTSIVWLRNAIALALVSGQAREECGNAKFADFRDGGWWNERTKTGARIFIPLELKLECFGMSLEDVLRQCRTTGILSKHLIHQTQRAKGAVLGKAMHVDMITRTFSAEVTKLGIGGDHPPTFH